MSIRRTAYSAIYDITEKGAYSNLRLKAAEESLSRTDAKWVSAAVYTTLDHLYYIDYVIDAFAKGKIKTQIRSIIRLGVCQAMYMNVPHSAACNESVKLTKEIGKGALSSFVNGIMRNICRAIEKNELPPLPGETLERLSIQYSYPMFLVKEYVQLYGAEFAEQIMASSYSGMTLRAQSPFTAKELEAELARRGIGFQKGRFVCDALRLESGFDAAHDEMFQEGQITVQSESAMLCCKLLDVRDGMNVLDACAAPGGKTAYISEMLHGTGHIDAFELHEHRSELTVRTLERLNVKNVSVKTCDAREYNADLEQKYDAVIVDAPCSGFGVAGKADARYMKTDALIDELCALQIQILDNCAKYVKRGGVLVYSTCTVSKRENEDVANKFLETHEDFLAADISGFLPEEAGKRVKNGMIQLFSHLDATEGFFMAKFIRA